MQKLNRRSSTRSASELFISAGILDGKKKIPDFMDLFVLQADQALRKVEAMISSGKLSSEKSIEFQRLLILVCERILLHPIIANNSYLRRFARGITEAQARFDLQQFSIFAHQFDVAQSQFVVNAPTEEAYLERLHVLLNEKGIPFKSGYEGELTGIWNLKHVHFLWLRDMAKGLGLRFNEIGKKKYALEGTRRFVDATFTYYASEDLSESLGAAFAIENWAGNYLWVPWISGMKKLNAARRASGKEQVKLGYLTYHEAEERHHSQATIDELLNHFKEDWFDLSRFLKSAEGVLDEGVVPYYVSQLKHLPEKEGNEWPDPAIFAASINSRRQSAPYSDIAAA